MASLYTDLFDEEGENRDQPFNQQEDEYTNKNILDDIDFQNYSPREMQDQIPISCWNDGDEDKQPSEYIQNSLSKDDENEYQDDEYFYDEEEKEEENHHDDDGDDDDDADDDDDEVPVKKRELEVGMDLEDYFNISSLLEALPQKEDLFSGCSMDFNDYDGDERSYLLELMQDPEYQSFLDDIKQQKVQEADGAEYEVEGEEDDEEQDEGEEQEEGEEANSGEQEYDNEDYEEEDDDDEDNNDENELKSSICKQLFTSFQSNSPAKSVNKASTLYKDIDNDDNEENYYDSFLSASKIESNDSEDDNQIEKNENLRSLNNFLSNENDDAEDRGEEEREMQLATQDLQNIMNDYTELLSYMNSPRAEKMVETINKSFNDGNFNKVEKILNKSFNNENFLKEKMGSKKKLLKKKKVDTRENDTESKEEEKIFKKKIPSSIILLPTAPTKKNFVLDNDNGVLNRLRKRGKPKSKTNPMELAALKKKQIEVLAKIAAKKKAEKDEQILQEEKVLERRKKFREALLEKAMKSRENEDSYDKDKEEEKEKEKDKLSKQKMPRPKQNYPPIPPQKETKEVKIKSITGANPPNFLLPTAAFKNQSIIKTTNQFIEDSEEYKKEQEMKKEIVMKMRKKFKEKHKMILQNLIQKKKEQDLKDEQEKAKEEQMRLKRKKRLDQLLSSRDSKKNEPSDENSTPTQSNKNFEAGSALSAIRKRQGKEVPMNKPTDTNPEVKENMKNQRMKLSEYFSNLAEQKKKEEQEKKINEERQKRRMAILSQRILQEANERKLMSKEDNSRYNTKVEPNTESEKKPKKFTQEMVDALTQRLQAGGSNSSRKEDGEKEKEKDKEKEKEKEKDSKSAPKPKVIKTVKKSDQNDQSYLNATTSSTQQVVNARDFSDWKRKNNIPQDAKVFCMTGWYPCVKENLIERGWYYNSDPTSTFFNLKWTLKSLDVCQETLLPWQLTNHYMKNVAITTKAGLIKSLQSLIWLADVDIRGVIPRGYDLSLQQDTQSFIDDYRCQHAEGILKKLYYKLNGLVNVPKIIKKDVKDLDNENNEDLLSQFNYEIPPLPPLNSGLVLSDIKINDVVFNSLCNVLEKQVHPYTENYIDDKKNKFSQDERFISDLDWEIISNYSLYEKADSLPNDPPTPVDAFLRNSKEDDNSKLSFSSQQSIQREKKKLQKQLEDNRDEASNSIRNLRVFTEEDYNRIHIILTLLYVYYGDQYGLNGNNINSSNFWIVKPAAKSRGRGIMTFNDLPKLLKYVDAGFGLSSQWIVQKYMENPLVIAERKFDLRQWVLVTDWNPLTIYFYEESYARFSVEKYSTEQTDLENCYIHLVNNSIGKNSEKFNDIVTAENGEQIEGFMWSYESFSKYVKDTSGKDLVNEKIRPLMKEIAKASLMCASEMIEHRKNSWELYGFDFMIDENYQPWLIEINSSPACDYSTKVTERYIKKALVELLKVVLDVREWEATPKNQRGEKPDTGDWTCIYQGPLLELPSGSFGIDITLKGEGLKAPRTSNINKISYSSSATPSPIPPLSSKTSNQNVRPSRTTMSINSLDRDSRKSFPKPSNGSSKMNIKKQKSSNDLISTDKDDPADFNDSESDEETRSTDLTSESSHIGRLRKLSEGKLQAEAIQGESKSEKKKTQPVPTNAVAVPVKVFSVEF